MKLQKLIYYCQSFHLALCDKTLFHEPIEAWPHGPVYPAPYHNLKYLGSLPVTVIADCASSLADSEKEIVRLVYDKYGQYSAGKLRQMTRDESPWKNAARGDGISKDAIKNFFARSHIHIIVPPEDTPPLAEEEKRIVAAALEELETSGFDLSTVR
ncbi:MAG: DUF4065 domain-containing protein [Treponema sp.]|jgi:uncharacterized phage-associated protein|nr:DUF4065 domain-containing protein [Treponema sp.]